MATGPARAQTFLVEHYWPGASVERFRAAVARVGAAVAEMAAAGAPLSFLHSTFVPEEENVLCVFASSSRELVEEAYCRAGVAFERVLLALDFYDSEAPAPPPGHEIKE